MHNQHLNRAPLVALLGLLLSLVIAPSAFANHVNATKSSAACVLNGDVASVTFKIQFEAFGANNKPVTGTITLDGTTAKAYGGSSAIDWPDGQSGFTLGYTKTVTSGAHTIRGDFTWPGKTAGDNGTVSKDVNCPTPPTTPPPTPPTPPAPAIPPTAPTAPTTPSTPTTPVTAGGGVLDEAAVSGVARLRGRSGCVRHAFTARVTGRSIASVAFYLDGHKLTKFNTSRTSYAIKINPHRYRIGRHHLQARVVFLAASHTEPRRIPLTFKRCAQATVAPRFAG
jgi:hypothetical protein